MTEGDVLNIAQQAMITILLLSAPLLDIGLLVTFLILGPWILGVIMDFTANLLSNYL